MASFEENMYHPVCILYDQDCNAVVPWFCWGFRKNNINFLWFSFKLDRN